MSMILGWRVDLSVDRMDWGKGCEEKKGRKWGGLRESDICMYDVE